MKSLDAWMLEILEDARQSDLYFRDFLNARSSACGDVENYHLYMLRKTLRYAVEHSAFYREAGISPEAIQTLDDLRNLPFTDPAQLSEKPYKFLCLSQANIQRIHNFITSGTTGPKKKIFWTTGDLDRIVRFMAAGIGTVASAGDVVHVWLPDGMPYSQADLLSRGVESIGARPVVVPMDIDSKDYLRLLEAEPCAVIFGFTHCLLRLTRELQCYYDLKRLGVRMLFLAAEYLPDAARADLQRTWNCETRTHYGLTEMGLGVAVECSAGGGYHFNEADLLLEIVDPKTGQPVNDDQEGELVFTTLTREAMPLIRYRTHDISRWIPMPCACGATRPGKFAAVKKRVGNIILLANGSEIYPSIFDDALMDMRGFVDYQAILSRRGNQEHLRFRVELAETAQDSIPEIKRRLLTTPVLSENIHLGNMTMPDVELAAPGSLKNTGRAKKLIYPDI